MEEHAQDHWTLDELRRLIRFCLDSKDQDIVRAGLAAVGTEPFSLRELCREELEKRLDVSQTARKMFGSHGCQEVIERAFSSALADPDLRVRGATCRKLLEVGGPRALVPMLRSIAAHDSSEMVRYFAGQVATKLHADSDLPSLFAPSECPTELERALVMVIVGRVPDFSSSQVRIALLTHSDYRIRQWTLDRANDLDASAILRALSTLAEPPPGEEVIRFVGSRHGKLAREILLVWARAPDYRRGRTSLMALRGHPIDDPDSLVRLYLQLAPALEDDVAALLATCGDHGVLCMLQFFQQNEAFRRSGGRLLAKVAGARALPALLTALEEPFRAVRESASAGLVALGALSIAPLLELLRTPRTRSRSAHVSALISVMRELRRRSHTLSFGDLDKVATEISSQIEELLADREGRGDGIELLGAHWRSDAYTSLLSCLGETGSEAQAAALRAQRELAENRVQPSIEAVRALGFWLTSSDFHDVQNDFLVVLALAMEGTPLVRREAADGLTQLVARCSPGDALRFRAQLAVGLTEAVHVIDSIARSVTSVPNEIGLLHVVLRRGADAQAKRQTLGRSGGRRASTAWRDTKMSVTAPQLVGPDSDFVLCVWLHDQTSSIVEKHGLAFAPGRAISCQTKHGITLTKSALLTVRLHLDGFELEETSDTLYWTPEHPEAVANCTFKVYVPKQARAGTHVGQASLWLHGLRIAKLDFAIRVGPVPCDDVADVSTDEERVRTAFASYAQCDLRSVLARIQGMQQLVPDLHVFLDVMSLRAGEDWQERLYREIVGRDVFLLFWSNAASQSEWVEREWRLALSEKGLAAINPVPLEWPSTPPPAELASLHFRDWTLAISAPE